MHERLLTNIFVFRVAFRENELMKRQDEKRLLQQKLSEEQEEKERRLEKLREQVGYAYVLPLYKKLKPHD
jgi:hypothetical protein